MAMRNQLKKIQRDLEQRTFDYENAGVRISVSGDLSVKSVKILDEELLSSGKTDKIERTLAENLNKALHLAKDGAQEAMKEATKGMDMSGLMS